VYDDDDDDDDNHHHPYITKDIQEVEFPRTQNLNEKSLQRQSTSFMPIKYHYFST
jgi:hypothetical protein